MPNPSTSFLTSQILCNAISRWPDSVSTGTILAQICDTPQSLAAVALRAHALTSRNIIGGITRNADPVSIPQLIEKADAIAGILGDNIVTPEHILLAIFALERSHAYQAIVRCNRSIKDIETSLMELMDLSDVLYVYKDDNGFLLSHWERWQYGVVASVPWTVSWENHWLCARSTDVVVNLNCSPNPKQHGIQGLVSDGKKILQVSVHRKSIKTAKTAVISFLHGALLK